MTQAEISVDECIKWLIEEIECPYDGEDSPVVQGVEFDKSRNSTIAHLRRLQEVEAELEKCRSDAERYRWLRDNKLRGIEDGKFIAVSRFYGLDEAIDAAISAGEGKDEG